MHSSPVFELLLTVEIQAFTVKLLSFNLVDTPQPERREDSSFIDSAC